jgi:phosphoribosylformylglycinamidine synthase
MDGIVGITNAGRNVVGLMPHPERAISELLGSTDGLDLWRSVLRSAELASGRAA